MADEVRVALERMLEKGRDLKSILTVCMYGKGVKVDLGNENSYWLNKSEDPDSHSQLIKNYEIPGTNGLPRLSHGVCANHKDRLGTVV